MEVEIFIFALVSRIEYDILQTMVDREEYNK